MSKKSSLRDSLAVKSVQIQDDLPPLSMFATPPQQVLGGGYSSDMQMPVLTCLTPSSISLEGGDPAFLGFDYSVSYSKFTENLIATYYETESWLFFSETITTTYTEYVQEDAYSQAFYFFDYGTFPSKVFGIDQWGAANMNALGLAAYNVSPDQFRATCGDQVAREEALGAGLFATLKLTFNSKEEKSTFQESGDFSLLGIFDLYEQIQAVVNSSSMSGTFEFLAYQLGGDTTQLAKVMSKNAANNQFHSTACNFTTMTDCSGAINALLDYAVNDYPQQVGMSGGVLYGNPVGREFVIRNYSDIGINVGNSVLNPFAEAQLAALTAFYLKTEEQQLFVSRILASESAPYIVPAVSSVLNNFTTAVSYNSELILSPINGIMGCYIIPKDCLEIVTFIDNKLMPINTTQIDEIIADFSNAYLFSLKSPTLANIMMMPIGSDYYHASNGTAGFLMPSPSIVMASDNSSITLIYPHRMILAEQITNGGSSSINNFMVNADITLSASAADIFDGTFPCNMDTPCSGQVSGESCSAQMILTDSGIF